MNPRCASISVSLGNWGTIECLNQEHKDYLIVAHAYSTIRQAVASWQGAWLSKEMKAEYEKKEREAKQKCDELWDKIPDKTDDLSKSH